MVVSADLALVTESSMRTKIEMASNKPAATVAAATAAATTVTAKDSDGKKLLRGLILRAEALLGKMIYKLEKTPVTLAEMVAMINSVHGFVDQWEQPLVDIRLEMLNIPGVEEAADVQQQLNEEQRIMEQISLLDRKQDRRMPGINKVDEPAEPLFEFLEQPLTNYKTDQIGRCVISSVGPGSRTFCMVNRDHPDVTKLFAAMQSMSSAHLYQLPPPGEVFGVRLDDSVFRAVRNKPLNHSPLRKDYIRLLDTGEILPYDGNMRMCSLSEYYRRIPAFAVHCLLVRVMDDPFCEDFDRYLKKSLRSIQHFKVVSAEKSCLFVELSQRPIVPSDQHSNTSSRESTPTKVKPISMMRIRAASPRSPQKPPRGNIFAVDSAEQSNPFTSIRFPAVPTAEMPLCPFNGSSECNLGAHKKIGLKTQQECKKVVPPNGSHLMLVPKFIRDVGHMWCHVVGGDYVNPDFREMELRMNDPEYSKHYKPLQEKPKMFQQVFAKYVDKRWYRAQVIRYFDERNVHVFYVDYGNAEMVRLEEIHQWDERFSYLPHQAVVCKLSNLKPAKPYHVPAVIELNRTLLNKRVRAEIVDNNLPWEIIVYDDDGFDISVGLVIAGLAKKIKEDEPDPTEEAPGA
ncbi:uncharacterized protein LOC134207835 isoform X2 [Armigeres subalbatus]|uniref:uncharacterized protein LOC134207835 isoform X2 n=1 Tax=Armigeres subalbatus TaxID=124917 RepID=UPI002ED420EE